MGVEKDKMHVGQAIALHKCSEVTGKIATTHEHMVTLADGKTFNFSQKPNDVDLSGYKAGDEVKIQSLDARKTHWGSAISPAEG